MAINDRKVITSFGYKYKNFLVDRKWEGHVTRRIFRIGFFRDPCSKNQKIHSRIYRDPWQISEAIMDEELEHMRCMVESKLNKMKEEADLNTGYGRKND